MILIISNKWDVSVDFVVRELQNAAYPYLRINSEDLATEQATITLSEFHIFLSKHSKTYDLTKDIRVIWYRRPGKPFDEIPKNKRPSRATQRFVNDQWYSWLEAIQLLPMVTWINDPRVNDAMENKIRQLTLATKVGFRIPETIVSNDSDDVRQMMNKYGGKLIAKSLYSPLIEEPTQDYFIFTTEIKESDLKNHKQLKITPVIFQEPLVPKVDYRVTVIADKVLAAKIEKQKDVTDELDWRTQKDGLNFVRCALPKKIEMLCQDYIKASGLIFGAIDLVEYNGEYVFLEVNPNGEWGWLQKPYGLPIAETLCKFMIKRDIK